MGRTRSTTAAAIIRDVPARRLLTVCGCCWICSEAFAVQDQALRWNRAAPVVLADRVEGEAAVPENCSESIEQAVVSNGVGSLEESLTDGSRAWQDCRTSFGLPVKWDVVVEVTGTALHRAASLGFKGIVEVLLAHNFGPNAALEERKVDVWFAKATPVMLAAAYGHDQVVSTLINISESVVQATSADLWTALSYAAYWGQEKVVKLLIEAPGVDVHAATKDGTTPLGLALKQNHAEVVDLLLHVPDVQINARDGVGQTPLMLAARFGVTQIFIMLLQFPDIDVNMCDEMTGMSALMMAAKEGHVEMVRLLVKRPKTEVNKAADWNGWTALMYAAKNGHREAAKLLLEDPNIAINAVNLEGETALTMAAGMGFFHVVRMLMRNPSLDFSIAAKDGLSALLLAAKKGHLMVVSSLTKRMPVAEMQAKYMQATSEDGSTALILAAGNGHPEVVDALLNYNEFVEIIPRCDKAGKTVLHHAAAAPFGQQKMVESVLRYLKNKFSPAEIRDTLDWISEENQTALQVAAGNGHLEVVEVLLGNGAHLRHPAQGRGSALRLAACSWHFAVARSLLEHGASVEADLEPEDLEGRRCAVWLGVDFSLTELVWPFVKEAQEKAEPKTEGDLWQAPEAHADAGEDGLLSHAMTSSMVHMLLSWQARLPPTDARTEERCRGLRMALTKNRTESALAFLSRGVGRECEGQLGEFQETGGPLGVNDLRPIQTWNSLHWTAYSCDALAFSVIFGNKDAHPMKLLSERTQAGSTPMDLARQHGQDCPGILGLMEVLQATERARLRETIISFVTMVGCAGSLCTAIFMLKMQTLRKHGCCFTAFMPILFAAGGVAVALLQGKRAGRPELLVVGASTAGLGALILAALYLAFLGGRFDQQLQQLRRFGNNKVDRCWEKLDCIVSVGMLALIFIGELLATGATVTLLAGVAHATASVVPFCTARPRKIVLPLRIITGVASVLGELIAARMAGTQASPPPILLAVTCFALAWADLPGTITSVVEAVEIEMSKSQTQAPGKFTASKLILGQAAVAAHGIEYALGLTPEALAEGLKDPLEAMRKEVLASGDAADRENFRYIVEGTSGRPEDYPSAVKKSLETGLYHGGELGPDDFDTGHAGRTLKDWMRVSEVRLSKLTEAEFVAVRFYTSSSFPKINGPLRKEVRPHPWAMVVYLIDRGIKKLRSVQAQVNPEAFAGKTVLWRGMKNLEVDVKEFASVGGTEMAPMSTTTNEEVARHYASSKVPLLFKYVVGGLKTGVSIQFLSLYPKEEEFLYSPLTFLSLKGHYEDDGTVILVVEPVMS